MLYSERITTCNRSEVLDITPIVNDRVRKAGVSDGICVIYVPHTTAAVSINENADPDVKQDILKKLDEMIPHHENFYQHSEGNSDSHLKTILTGPSVTLIINDGQLLLGTWQGIYFCEFDGPRTRTFHIKILGTSLS